MAILSITIWLWMYIVPRALSFPLAVGSPSNDHGHMRRTIGPQLEGLNFPDPSVILVEGIWYSFATRTIGSNIHIQVALSDDFESWKIVNNEDGSQ
ncbi:hypothetical protein LTR37_019947 [Vermiconidia calcicola]|uniref:Uncharacterized protein n=1 Tax=Vermiconidia calcicola TaxID=1690605 RepID=A0ACC3MFQ5_9PEZI|nr:hypothetical protein LTR37_019947 [Vermiconidia calcicola]